MNGTSNICLKANVIPFHSKWVSGPFRHLAKGTSFFPASLRIGENVGQESRQANAWPMTLSSLGESSIAKAFETHSVAGITGPLFCQWAPGPGLSLGACMEHLCVRTAGRQSVISQPAVWVTWLSSCLRKNGCLQAE